MRHLYEHQRQTQAKKLDCKLEYADLADGEQFVIPGRPDGLVSRCSYRQACTHSALCFHLPSPLLLGHVARWPCRFTPAWPRMIIARDSSLSRPLPSTATPDPIVGEGSPMRSQAQSQQAYYKHYPPHGYPSYWPPYHTGASYPPPTQPGSPTLPSVPALYDSFRRRATNLGGGR